MPLTESGITFVDPVLSEIYASAIPEEEQYIARKILRSVVVDGKSYKGQIECTPARYFMGQRHIDPRRAPGGNIPMLTMGNPHLVTYECEERWGGTFVDQTIARRNQSQLSTRDRQIGTQRRFLLDWLERDVLGELTTAGNWGANTSTFAAIPGGTGNKVGTAGAEEFTDLKLAKWLAEERAHGRKITAALCGTPLFRGLANATQLNAIVGNDKQRANMPEAELHALVAAQLGIKPEKFYVSEARSEAAEPGATSSEDYIVSDSILFFFDGEEGAVSPVEGGASALGHMLTAVLVFEDLGEGSVDNIAAQEWETRDPPGTKTAGAWSYDLAFITEAEGAAPFGFLVTDCI